MEKSFLQSNEWAEFQRSLGREVFEYDKEGISAKIIKQELSFHKNYLYIPYGPEVDFNQMSGGFKNPFNNFKDYLKQLAKENKSIFVNKSLILSASLLPFTSTSKQNSKVTKSVSK